MDDFDTLARFVDAFPDVATTVVFLWLFVRVLRSHEKTRAAYRRDLRNLAKIEE